MRPALGVSPCASAVTRTRPASWVKRTVPSAAPETTVPTPPPAPTHRQFTTGDPVAFRRLVTRLFDATFPEAESLDLAVSR